MMKPMPKRKKDPPPEGKRGVTSDDLVDVAFDVRGAAKKLIKYVVRIAAQRPAIAAFVTVFTLAVVFGGRLVGVDAAYWIPPLFGTFEGFSSAPILRNATWISKVTTLQPCIAVAQGLQRPYVMANVVQWVDYELAADEKTIQVHERIIYTVLPLRPIRIDEQAFLEEYSGSHVVAHWFGPRRESFIGGGNKYQVSFPGERGVPVTLTTGAEFSYDWPLQNGRQAFREKRVLNSDADFWYYENIDDAICQLTQVVESRTLELLPIGRGGMRVGHDADSEGDVAFQVSSTRPITNSALSMQWKDVSPGEDVGLMFTLRKR